MKPLVRMESVSKIYPRVHQPWERVRALNSILMGREPAEGAKVLEDIDLEIRPGESLGIIGPNGAGKSTLLKILTGVIRASSGTVELNAKTAALLELGAGFQPDFSGMDNVRMKASLLGMGRSEFNAKLEYILDFANIGEYIHEPVKHYSSGMVVRLGFAVVAASEPELLITDEVLAVGDESFQNKCIKWIESFRSNGGTLLMVSHSMYIVQKLCRHALWLQAGRAEKYGDVFPVTQSYLAWHEARSAAKERLEQKEMGETGRCRVAHFSIRGFEPESAAELEFGNDLEIEMVIISPDGRTPVAMAGIVRVDGTPVYGVGSDNNGQHVRPEKVSDHKFHFRLRFPAIQLLPGCYLLRAHSMDPEGVRVTDTQELPLTITGETNELGMVRLRHEWQD